MNKYLWTLKPFIKIDKIIKNMLEPGKIDLNNLEVIFINMLETYGDNLDDFLKEIYLPFEINAVFITLQSHEKIIESSIEDKKHPILEKIWNFIKNGRKEYKQKLKNERKKLMCEIISQSKNKGDHSECAISAPPSFGKSTAVIESINKLMDENILFLIVCPTISLINEYSKKFEKTGHYFYLKDIKNEEYSQILITTIDRVYSEEWEKYKARKVVLIIDEYYSYFNFDKMQMLKILVNKIKNISTISIIKISPQKVNSSTKLIDEVETKFLDYNYEASTRYIHHYEQDKKEIRYRKDIALYASKKRIVLDKEVLSTPPINNKDVGNFIEMLYSEKKIQENENILSICSKEYSYKCLQKEADNIKNKPRDGKYITFMKKYIEAQIDSKESREKYWFYNALNLEWKGKRFIYHNGSVDKLLRYLVERAFEKKEIDIIFSTTTITKGVNLNPDNILLFKYNGNNLSHLSGEYSEENKKGINEIEIKNAISRTGRSIDIERESLGNVHVFLSNDSKSIFDYIDSEKESDIKLNEESIEIKEPKETKDMIKICHRLSTQLLKMVNELEPHVNDFCKKLHKNVLNFVEAREKGDKDNNSYNGKRFIQKIYEDFLALMLEIDSFKKYFQTWVNKNDLASCLYKDKIFEKEVNMFINQTYNKSLFKNHEEYIEGEKNYIDKRLGKIYDVSESWVDYFFKGFLRNVFRISYIKLGEEKFTIEEKFLKFDESYEITIEKEKELEFKMPFGIDKIYNRSSDGVKQVLKEIFETKDI